MFLVARSCRNRASASPGFDKPNSSLIAPDL
jgi:hypothetical protein